MRSVDVVFSNLRGDQPANWGSATRTSRHVNERIVCVSLSGFGQTGPRAAQGAYDYTMQGLAGWQSVTGEPDGPPVKSGLSLVDYCGGYVAAIAILAGVLRARRDGVGADVDLSLFEVALAQLTYVSTWVASREYVPVRRPNSAHQSIVPFQNLPTADGWIVVACPEGVAVGAPLRRARQIRPATDARSATFSARSANRDYVLGELFAVFRTRPRRSGSRCSSPRAFPWRLSTTSRPRSPTRRSGALVVLADRAPVLGTVRQVASPLRSMATVPRVAPRPVPRRAHGGRPAGAVRLLGRRGRAPDSSEHSARSRR